MSSHPPWLLPPASCSSRGLWDVAGACHSLPSAAELWAPRASEYRAELREERAPPGTLPTGKRPRSLFVQRLRFLAKFSQHKDQHLGTAPECGEEVVSARQMFQQSMSLEGRLGEGEERRNIQDRPTSA